MTLQPECVADALGDVAGAVVAEEWSVGEVAVELGPVGGSAGADCVEDVDRQPLRIVVGAQHQRWDSRHEDQPGDPASAVAADVVHDLAAASGVPDERHVRRSRFSMSRARSSAYVSISLPSHVWRRPPCPRRSWTITR